ncbi:hypothetical protein H0H93_008715 [Arthromyces matolae]|nr:hypothetical protein H0H93_008715 [Arthromyces matolae]
MASSRKSRVSKRKRSKSVAPHILESKESRSLPVLPPEIYLIIFAFATSIPEAFDTSFEGIQTERKRKLLVELMFSCTSMRAKLSIVSKSFHSIMENLLYEIIVITRFQTIPIVLDSLRHVPPGRNLPRGNTCRRLDISIPILLNHPSYYLNEAWDVGRNTLWGLLAACPNLEILIARNVYSGRDYYTGSNDTSTPHLGHNALCKTISTYCASTLHRLELSGFDLPMDRVEMMLRYMSKLEICSISDCRPFNDIQHRYGRDYSDLLYCKRRGYDENEEEEIYGIVASGKRASKSKKPGALSKKKARLLKKSQLFGNKITELYAARDHAQWPSFHGGLPPYSLPKLHSFHLNKLTERIFEFKLPSLRSLSTEEVVHEQMLFNTTLVPHVTEGPAPLETTFESMIERPSKYDIHPKYDQSPGGPYYTNPIPHSTPFGIFPNTITHLTIGFDIALAKILYFFPNITNLTWHYRGVSGLEVPFFKAHDQLQHITIRDDMWTRSRQRVITGVVNAVRGGWLLSVSDIVVVVRPLYHWRCRDPVQQNPFELCKRVGIELTVVETY